MLSAAFIGGPAYAQTAQPADPAATATARPRADKMMLKGHWRASKLMGLDVYNDANEKLGDINELILDKDGKVNAVVIGVGGFLGMGEHDIAVSMDKLKFMEEAGSHQSRRPRPRRPAKPPPAPRPRPAPAAPRRLRPPHAAANANDWTPDHAVMSGDKDQLKALPQFKYSDYN